MHWRAWVDRVWGEGDDRVGWLRRVLRLTWLLLSPQVRGPLALRATSLAYTTLLALVPSLAVSFSLLKAFGVHHQVRPLLEEFLAPLGVQGGALAARLVAFVNQVDTRVLGAAGLVLLVYTAVALINKIEEAFNAVWRVSQARSFVLRLSGYLSVLLLGPVLLFSLAAFVVEHFGGVALGGALPFLLTVAAFWFVYLLLPNTRVKGRPALWAALWAAVVWRLSGMAFAHLVAGSARYEALYSSFVGTILFLLWLQLSWLIFLAGAQVAFYLQHPERMRRPGQAPPGPGAFEAVGLGVLFWVLRRFRQGEVPPDTDALESALNADPELLEAVLRHLRGVGLVYCDAEERWLPARDLSGETVGALWSSLRGEAVEGARDGGGLRLPGPVWRLLQDVQQGAREAAMLPVARWLEEGEEAQVTPLSRRRDV